MKSIGYEFGAFAKNHQTGIPFTASSRLLWFTMPCMVVVQLPGWNSLRDIIENVSAQMHQLNHLGCRAGQKSNGRTCYRTFEFTGAHISNRCPTQPSLIGYKCALTGQHQAFLTNNIKLLVWAIADIYRARLQVELSFERVYLSLKMKIFPRTIKNAVITGVSGRWCGDFAQLIVGEAQIADRAGSGTAADHVGPGNGGVHRKVRARG